MDRLRALIAAELDHAADPHIAALATPLTTRPGVLAVLLYGARRRVAAQTGGPVDLYVLTEGDAAYHGWRPAALGNRLLPPNVYHLAPAGPDGIQAKVAVIRLAAFRAAMRPRSLDTTLWARFSQPVTLVWARDDAIRQAVIDAITQAARTAAWWACRLSPPGASAAEAWHSLYTATYSVELRVERGDSRAADLVVASAERFDAIYQAAIATDPPPSDRERRRAARAWRNRRRIGKPLNIARLTKAALTYEGGIAYALAKVERHSGRPVELSPWQRRWPWLAAPLVLWRLFREKRLR